MRARRYPYAVSVPMICISLALVLLAFGCAGDPYEGDENSNIPPRVWLSAAPPEGTTNGYYIRMYWGGWDPDGDIAYFEYVITDNEGGSFDPADTTGRDKWNKVFSNDSTLKFTSDELVDSNTTSMISEFQRSHTFFIRAVDDKGVASQEPAHRSFTTFTLSPMVHITIPPRKNENPASVPGITTFRWFAEDYIETTSQVQDPDSVRWILRSVQSSDFEGAIDWIRRHPTASAWSDWRYYGAPGDSGRFWTTPPIDYGPYVFAIQAKDEVGAITPVFDELHNVRRIQVSKRITGPFLTVINEFLGSVLTMVETTPVTIMDIPAGVPLTFRWTANADDYGGTVVGYRYGWDIDDLSVDDQWDISYTPFTSESASSKTKEYFYGTHTFTIEVKDNSGYKSRVEVKVNIVQFTMERGLFLVDDFFEEPSQSGFARSSGAIPSDEEHDDFWYSVLENLDGFDSERDVIEVRGGDVFPIQELARYKTLIWDAYGGYDIQQSSRPMLSYLVNFRTKDVSISGSGGGGKVQPNLLTLFMAAGGHVLLCGDQPLTQVIDKTFFSNNPLKFPIIFKYELEGNQSGRYGDQIDSGIFVGDRSFAYYDACVDFLDVAHAKISTMRDRQTNSCPSFLIRNEDFVGDGLRECIPLDPAFPTMTLRPEVTLPGYYYAPDNRGYDAELYNPGYFLTCTFTNTRDCFEPIYGNGCLNTSSVVYEAPVAGWSHTYADVLPQIASGAVAARSAYFGFEPAFFNPDEVREAIEHIIFDEWLLPRK